MALKTIINGNGKLMVIYEKHENGCCSDYNRFLINKINGWFINF